MFYKQMNIIVIESKKNSSLKALDFSVVVLDVKDRDLEIENGQAELP